MSSNSKFSDDIFKHFTNISQSLKLLELTSEYNFDNSIKEKLQKILTIFKMI